jgi:hypothetical protein
LEEAFEETALQSIGVDDHLSVVLAGADLQLTAAGVQSGINDGEDT